jgi:hypothetical protein
MDPSYTPEYEHTQTGPWYLMLMAVGVVFLSVGWFVPGDPVSDIVLPVGAWAMAFLAMSFRTLTVVDRGDHLALRFGPVPLFRKRVRYQDLQRVTPGRLSILDGWGIHYSLRGGWVWSMWGFDCVDVRHRDRTLRIGTDDAENLAKFLEGQRQRCAT